MSPTLVEGAEPGRTRLLARNARAEWNRLWSVRSTWWFALATAVVALGVATLLGIDVSDNTEQAEATAWFAGQFAGLLCQFGLLAMAVVTATADHGTGGIVPTLQWTPRRRTLLAARAGVIASTTTLLGLALVAAASVVGWLFAPSLGLPADEGTRVLAGVGLVYASGTLLAVGLGLALRNTAAALVGVLALMLVLPILLAVLGFDWTQRLAELLPGYGAFFLLAGEGPGSPTAAVTEGSARLTLGCWALAAMVAGGWRLLRADADR